MSQAMPWVSRGARWGWLRGRVAGAAPAPLGGGRRGGCVVWVLLQRLPCPRPLSRACQPSFSRSCRSFRLPYCALHTGGEGAAGKNASGPFLAGGALAPAATFLDRDNAAKSEGSDLVAPPSPVSPEASDCSASLMSRPFGRFAACGCVICLSCIQRLGIVSSSCRISARGGSWQGHRLQSCPASCGSGHSALQSALG